MIYTNTYWSQVHNIYYIQPLLESCVTLLYTCYTRNTYCTLDIVSYMCVLCLSLTSISPDAQVSLSSKLVAAKGKPTNTATCPLTCVLMGGAWSTPTLQPHCTALLLCLPYINNTNTVLLRIIRKHLSPWRTNHNGALCRVQLLVTPVDAALKLRTCRKGGLQWRWS